VKPAGVDALHDTADRCVDARGRLAGQSGTYHKLGAGVLTLSGPSQMAGQLRIQEGAVRLGAGASIGPAAVDVAPAAELDLAGVDALPAIAGLSGAGRVTLGAFGLRVDGPASTTFGGTIAGTGGITKVGPGTAALDGLNTYTGLTTILEGTLRARPQSLSEQVDNRATLVPFDDRTGPSVIAPYSGSSGGSGALVKEGDGTVWLRGRNTFTGGTTVAAGTLIGNTDSLTGDISNQASLAFYQVQDGSFGGAIDGPGLLLKYGPGTLTLAGVNTQRGGTVFGGTLEVARNESLGAAEAPLLMVGGTLLAAADLASARAVGLAPAEGGFDTGAHEVRWSGVISGPGGLTKSGSGTLILDAASTYAGPTAVAAGRLQVKGSIPGDVSVAAGAERGGGGQIGGDVALQGRLARGGALGPTRIAGDLSLAPGSTLLMRVDAAGKADRITLTGADSVAEIRGGTLQVQAGAGRYRRETDYTILTAPGAVSGRFDGESSELAFLTPALSYDTGGVVLRLSRNDLELAALAGTADQAAAARALGGLPPGPGDAGEVIEALTALDAVAARSAFESAAGVSRVSLTRLALDSPRALLQAVSDRLAGTARAGARSEISRLAPPVLPVPGLPALDHTPAPAGAAPRGDASGPATAGGLWIEGMGGTGRVDADGASGGYDYRLGGVVLGYERRLDSGLVAGALGAYSRPDLEQGAERMQARVVQIGAYGRLHRGPAHLDMALGHGGSRFETSRRVAAGGLERAAAARFDGQVSGAYLEAGHTFPGRVEIQPLLALAWTRQRPLGPPGAGGRRAGPGVRGAGHAIASIHPGPAGVPAARHRRRHPHGAAGTARLEPRIPRPHERERAAGGRPHGHAVHRLRPHGAQRQRRAGHRHRRRGAARSAHLGRCRRGLERGPAHGQPAPGPALPLVGGTRAADAAGDRLPVHAAAAVAGQVQGDAGEAQALQRPHDTRGGGGQAHQVLGGHLDAGQIAVHAHSHRREARRQQLPLRRLDPAQQPRRDPHARRQSGEQAGIGRPGPVGQAALARKAPHRRLVQPALGQRAAHPELGERAQARPGAAQVVGVGAIEQGREPLPGPDL
jgi:outer membrane autotransporter protein